MQIYRDLSNRIFPLAGIFPGPSSSAASPRRLLHPIKFYNSSVSKIRLIEETQVASRLGIK